MQSSESFMMHDDTIICNSCGSFHDIIKPEFKQYLCPHVLRCPSIPPPEDEEAVDCFLCKPESPKPLLSMFVENFCPDIDPATLQELLDYQAAVRASWDSPVIESQTIEDESVDVPLESPWSPITEDEMSHSEQTDAPLRSPRPKRNATVDADFSEVPTRSSKRLEERRRDPVHSIAGPSHARLA